MRRPSLALAALVLVAACHRTTEPPPPGELFQLTSIDGRPLPTTRSIDPANNGTVILHEVLALGAQGVATRTTTVQAVTSAAVSTTIISYAYTRVGDVVTLGNVLCGPGALCIQHFPEEGPIDGDVLTLSSPQSMPTPGPVLVYQRFMTLLD